ncbi:MAG TPA: DsbC family protein [Burkholderiales bacterium]|nr:DsbC family protein [Burkholderiales bacterium]
MSRMLFHAVLLSAAALGAHAAHASEAAIQRAFQAKLSEAKVESVSRTPMPGLYEVVADGLVFYTDEKVNFIIRGMLFDARTGKLQNLTLARNAQLVAQALDNSTDNAIKRVRGNGKRVIYTFEDPNCGYCRQQQKELLKLDDITVYTFLWPILSPDSVEKSKAVWCSRDRARAWEDLMLRGVAPQGGSKCDTPIEKNMELARRFGANGTPAVFLADGRMIGGYVSAQQIEEALKSLRAR